MKKIMALLAVALLLVNCDKQQKVNGIMFKDDVAFLQKHMNVIVLSSQNQQAQIAVIPDLQGRVMTSTATGADGLSFGWINRELITSGENNKHINAFGGEDRFWLGPEGGQFSIFFKPGDPFDLDHWWTPEPINEGAYQVVEQNDRSVHFQKEMSLLNFANTSFNLSVDRTVRLLDAQAAGDRFNYAFPPELNAVAFESQNVIKNIGAKSWIKETGLLSIWILGMYLPSPSTTIVIPFRAGAVQDLGPKVNDAYFGQVPADRLVMSDSVLFFSGDGEYRSKIGISPYRAKKVLGSYDALNHVLTLVTYSKPDQGYDYVNSMWEIQEHPFAGDVVNSYNDGPASPGAKPMGPFYELETSSPAAALAPMESLQHTHTTLHLQGSPELLSPIARALLGVDLAEITSALP